MSNDPFDADGAARAESACALSVVVPVFNEEDALPAFHRRLVEALTAIRCTWEVVYVDDGSSDTTPRVLKELQASEPAIGVARLSRNFGKEAAMTAGLRLAQGESVVVMDADLQHPPEAIVAMVDAWRYGADVVSMRRRSRKGEAWLKRVGAALFYRTINRMSDVPILADVGDFRLLSREQLPVERVLPGRQLLQHQRPQ